MPLLFFGVRSKLFSEKKFCPTHGTFLFSDTKEIRYCILFKRNKKRTALFFFTAFIINQ